MISRSLAVLGTLAFAGCSTLNQIADENGGNSGIGNAIVIEEQSLSPARGGVVTIMQSHVRGMLVDRNTGCPHIVLRGGPGRSPAAEPLVYIDGQRISDTCILDGLNVESIARAEVYPSGVTHRPGYHSNSGGLILIFMKNGEDARLY